jgi:SAM-dependent methyltransferase
MSSSDHVERNRQSWNAEAERYVEPGRRSWASHEPRWGIWGIPESELNVLPDVGGKDVIELGCGTAYWSAWLARRGAKPVGIDISEQQLESARGFQREHGIEFPLLRGNAEEVPYPDGSFDLAFSEYGAAIWCDPYRWIPEASRLLRPGGELIFLGNSSLLMLCTPADGSATCDTLQRDYFTMRRFEWPDEGSIEFHLPYGEWIRLFRANGLVVDDLVEIQAPEGGDPGQWDFVTEDWARRWPSEQIWKLRKNA